MLHSTKIRHADGERGAVLLTMIVLVMTMGMLAMFLIETSADVSTRTEFRAQDLRLRAISDTAADLSMHHLWNRYKAYLGAGRESSLSSFRQFLDAIEIPARVGSPSETGDFHIFGSMTYDEPEWVNLSTVSGLPTNLRNNPSLGGVNVHGIEVLREDGAQSTALRVRAVVSFGTDSSFQREEYTERVYFAGGERFSGFDYALLANNVNCIMCHAQVDSVERYYNSDSSKYGTFPRVRAGTLESLKIRAGKAASRVAGAFYTRGPVMDKDGTLLAGLGGSSLDSAVFNADGELAENGAGNLTSSTFVNATGDPLPSGENLYLNYPVDLEKQVDGPMPEEFPSVIPDANGNRIVDDAEFLDASDGADGTITGGMKVLVKSGSVYGSSGLPGSDSVTTISGMVGSHTLLIGTAAKPLILDGKIAVDGDVVIAGVVKGTGTLIARNNVYILGPITYADGTDADGNRTFGRASDGVKNRLTLAAGGNIMAGGFLVSKDDTFVTGETTGAFSFVMSEITLFNQMEWTKTQPMLPDVDGVDAVNPLYNPDHNPRYYTIYDDNPVAIYNKGTATVDKKGKLKVSGTYFNAPTATWLGKEHLGSWDTSLLSMVDQSDASMAGASVVSLMPNDDWISAVQLKSMWASVESSHGGGPFEIDAFLYTSNSIMLLTRKASAYGGQALVNGGLVGADLGILVPGTGGVGMQLNYDNRHTDVIKLRESTLGELELLRGPRIR